MMFQKYEGTIIALSPIFHGGNEKTGSTPLLRTVRIWSEEKKTTLTLPYISGNSIRGKLRRLIMQDFFSRIAYPKERKLKLHHIFFTGGVLESTDTYGKIDLELRMQIQDFIPPLSIFGSVIGNQMIAGKMKVGHAFPFCQEYRQSIPADFQDDERLQKPVRIFTDESFYTRKDDLKAEREEDEQAIQMKVDYECFIPGTRFHHWFLLEYPTEIELSCFGYMMELWSENPNIGGSFAIGDGKISFSYYPEFSSGKLYQEFIEKNQQEIIEILRDLEQRL